MFLGVEWTWIYCLSHCDDLVFLRNFLCVEPELDLWRWCLSRGFETFRSEILTI